VKFPIQDAKPPIVATATARNDFAAQGGSANTASQADGAWEPVEHASSSIMSDDSRC
jgi:hypothetical protein